MDYLRSTFTSFLLYFSLQIVQGFELPNVSPRTCIIGAGYSGLATAKYLKEYNMEFTVFEASMYLGGVWHFDPRVGVDDDGIPIFSKTYKNLRMNSPHLFTEFNDFPFPEGTSSFLSWECVHKYLISLATKFELLQHIQFRRLVTSVKRFEDQWQLTYWRGDTRETVTEICDFVVIATGRYSNPVWPEIQDADIFQGDISHSATYRGETEVYRSHRVLIVGAGPTGLDLASQILGVASKLIHSHHSIDNMPFHEETYVKKPDIKSFTPNGVIFTDGSFEEVDYVIYCTGYSMGHYPFLDDSSDLIINGEFILPLYRKIVNIKHPSMLFVGAVTFAIQKVMNVQGNYAASLIAGRFQLPSEDEMMKSWVDEVNDLQDIALIASVKDNIRGYLENLSQEASIPPLLPVYNPMSTFLYAIHYSDYNHLREYDWYIIDDYNFDRVYVGPREPTCPIV